MITPEISVIIPQYNHACWTLQTLSSLERFEDHTVEIIIVDDGSEQKSRDDIRCVVNDRISLLTLQHYGVTHAWNAGALQARGQYLVFLNNDVYINGPFLSRVCEPLKNLQWEMAGVGWRKQKGLNLCMLQGWCFAINKTTLLKLNGFYEGYALYFSDTDLQLRLLEDNGWKENRCVVPSLPLIHKGHQTTHQKLSDATGNINIEQIHRADKATFFQRWNTSILKCKSNIGTR